MECRQSTEVSFVGLDMDTTVKQRPMSASSLAVENQLGSPEDLASGLRSSLVTDTVFRLHAQQPGGCDNVVRVMLYWAAYEWDEGLLSTEEVRALFGPGLINMPREDVSTYLREASFIDVATKLLGTTKEPVNSAQFLDSYQRLLE
ncbi:hypothetical protein HD806DRAFT_536563 [Xylariaceae sp. AK1471]|nr:hypothetical protein HD806DRAFT_536563 [Xylariaceae sp. AK1471]